MRKLNNKGFLLAESLIVSTFVLSVLVLLFVQFKTLYNSFEDSQKYNTVEGIYNLNTLKKYIINNEIASKKLSTQMTNGYTLVISNGTCQAATGLENISYCNKIANAMDIKTLLYTGSNISTLNTSNTAIFNQSFKDFIGKIQNSSGKQRIIGQFNNGTYATLIYG